VPAQQRDAFESALRRHGQDEEQQALGPAAAAPWGAALPPNASLPMNANANAAQESASAASPAGAPPRTAAALDAVSKHLRALGAASSSAQVSAHSSAFMPNSTDAVAMHWQMQWAGATAPVQQVDLTRADNGTLQLDMTGQAFATDPARLARLRDRVAARSQAAEVSVQGHTHTHMHTHTPGTQGPRGLKRHAGQHPFDDEGDVS
jgi:hypothetical protein